jgi:hypothetical protein
LEHGSRQRRDKVNIISNTTSAHHFGTEIPADRFKVSVHPWSHVQAKLGLAILRAKDDVNDDLN